MWEGGGGTIDNITKNRILGNNINIYLEYMLQNVWSIFF